jgi:hypothetical protein
MGRHEYECQVFLQSPSLQVVRDIGPGLFGVAASSYIPKGADDTPNE